jgi:hypothetical protein
MIVRLQHRSGHEVFKEIHKSVRAGYQLSEDLPGSVPGRSSAMERIDGGSKDATKQIH